MLSLRNLALGVCAVGALSAADPPSFEKTVQPMLTQTCAACHNAQMAAGGLNIAAFTKASSLGGNRDDWQRILDKLKSGDMPPAGVPKPPQMAAAIQFLQAEFDRQDRNIRPD